MKGISGPTLRSTSFLLRTQPKTSQRSMQKLP